MPLRWRLNVSASQSQLRGQLVSSLGSPQSATRPTSARGNAQTRRTPQHTAFPARSIPVTARSRASHDARSGYMLYRIKHQRYVGTPDPALYCQCSSVSQSFHRKRPIAVVVTENVIPAEPNRSSEQFVGAIVTNNRERRWNVVRLGVRVARFEMVACTSASAGQRKRNSSSIQAAW